MEDSSNDYDLDNDDLDETDDYEDDNNRSFIKRKVSTDSLVPLSNKYSNRKRKCRTTFSKSQLGTLEKEFHASNFVSNDRIDLIIELTGLDSRIIKNWFKNKRSRVLADTKTTTNPPGSQILTNSPSLNTRVYETPKQQLFVQTANLNSSYKENQTIATSEKIYSTYDQFDTMKKLATPGLLNITTSAYDSRTSSTILPSSAKKENVSSTKVAEMDESRKTRNIKNTMVDSSCQTCLTFSKVFCKCNVSKQALTSLYSGLNGYNATFLDHTVGEFGFGANGSGEIGQQICSKTFEIL